VACTFLPRKSNFCSRLRGDGGAQTEAVKA
jgi:hypothetical protein